VPAKPYFRIGEVSHLVGVEPHVLRYWEREFRSIRPTKSAKGQRVYSQRDVERLLRVRDLLYTQGFTIAGAKKQLQDAPSRTAAAPPKPALAPARSVAPPPAPPHDAPSSPPVSAAFVRGTVAPRDGGGARRELVLLREEIEALLCDLSE
jgi:DNA-binding transcriptional MerR regulator